MLRTGESFLLLFCIFVMAVLILEVVELRGDNKIPSTTQFSKINKKATNYKKRNITVLQIIDNLESAQKKYKTAMRSVHCYVKNYKNYRLKIVQEVDFQNVCDQKNDLVRRYCIITQVMNSEAKESLLKSNSDSEFDSESRNSDEWIVYLDADVAVVNPEVALEQYIDENFDLTLSDRYATWQISSSSIIIRNSEWSRTFFENFVSFSDDLEHLDRRTDGIFHVYLQHTFFRSLTDDVSVCRRILNSGDIFTFETCFRALLGDVHQFGKVKILGKEHSITREIWLTDSKWSPNADFMLSGLREQSKTGYQKSALVDFVFGPFNWRNPFSKELEHCAFEESYDKKLIVAPEVVRSILSRRNGEMEKKKWKSLSKIADFL